MIGSEPTPVRRGSRSAGRHLQTLTERQSRFLVYLAAVALLAVLAGALWMAWRSGGASANEKQLIRERVGTLTLDMDSADVLAQAGPPDQTCPGGEDSVRHQTGFLSAERRRAHRQLGLRTAERWVYGLPDQSWDDRSWCGADYNEAELGFSDDGRLVWFMLHANESHLTF